MNLLHGDHVIPQIVPGLEVVTTLGSHDVGTPCMILTKGLVCCPYSFHTIDILGESGRAE